MGVGEDAVRAADVVVDHLRFAFHQLDAGVLLVINDLQQHLVEPLDDVALGLAEGHLVGNLKDVAQRLGAFPVKPAHGKAELVDGLNDLVDLFTQHQPRQVQHRAHANAGAQVGGAGSEVAAFFRVGKIKSVLEVSVKLVDGVPCVFDLQSGKQRLHAEVILFVDHHADILVLTKHEAAAGVFRGVFAADEMSFDENLFVERGQLIHAGVEAVLHRLDLQHVVADVLEGLDAHRFFCPAGEWGVGEVSGKAHAARPDDLVRRAFSLGGCGGAGKDLVNVHRVTGSWRLRRIRISGS